MRGPAALLSKNTTLFRHIFTHVSDVISRVQVEKGTTIGPDQSQKLASPLVTWWFGAIVRRKLEPSFKPIDEFVPFFVRSCVL
jgi:Tetracyclin repressor-like, C-terminal domain